MMVIVNGELQVTLETGEVLRPEMVLFATGRLINTEGLGLDTAGVKLNRRGVVEVDNHFQTSIEGIYAAGDVIGPSLRYPQSKNKKPKSVKNPVFNQYGGFLV